MTKFLSAATKALKARMTDTQANLKPLAATALGKLLSVCDPPVAARLLRPIAGALLGGFSDAKASMRSATVAALHDAVTHGQAQAQAQAQTTTPVAADAGMLAVLVGPAAEALSNPVGRQEVLQFFLAHADALRPHADCDPLAAALITAMQVGIMHQHQTHTSPEPEGSFLFFFLYLAEPRASSRPSRPPIFLCCRPSFSLSFSLSFSFSFSFFLFLSLSRKKSVEARLREVRPTFSEPQWLVES
jgi:hypothetical protein